MQAAGPCKLYMTGVSRDEVESGLQNLPTAQNACRGMESCMDHGVG